MVVKTPEDYSVDEIIKHLPTSTSLIYVDRNDSLDEQLELLQNCISDNSFDALHDEIDKWYWESKENNLRKYKKDIRKALETEHGIDSLDAEEIIDFHEEAIDEIIYDRCDDNTVQDLISNTSSMICHYDAGYQMPADSWNWNDAEIRLERIKIKQHLKIKTSVYDPDIDMMIQQASYGGALLIYFNLTHEFYEFIGKMETAESIIFEDYMFGIVDHFNGSGDVMNVRIADMPVALDFNRDNIWFEKSIKYNWTYSIAGMCLDWADSTVFSFSDIKLDEKIDSSEQVVRQAKEKEYNRIFKEGSCTSGDMDINRHRNTAYINNFPCGNRCNDCHTFWID